MPTTISLGRLMNSVLKWDLKGLNICLNIYICSFKSKTTVFCSVQLVFRPISGLNSYITAESQQDRHSWDNTLRLITATVPKSGPHNDPWLSYGETLEEIFLWLIWTEISNEIPYSVQIAAHAVCSNGRLCAAVHLLKLLIYLSWYNYSSII